MTTYDTFLGGPKMRVYQRGLILLEKRVHLGVQGLAANDVHQAIPVLENDVILNAWAKVESRCDDDATIDLGYGTNVNYWGNKLLVDSTGHCKTLLHGTLTWNAYEINDKSEHTNEKEITGVRFGDHVTVSSGMDLADMALSGAVIHKNWVAVTLVNNTGGCLDLASQSFDIAVNKAPQATSPLLIELSDTIDITANNVLTKGVIVVSALIFRK